MNKVIKWVVLALMLVGVAATAYVFVDGSAKQNVSVTWVLWYTYFMVGLSLVAVLYSIISKAIVNPKSLIVLGSVLVGTLVLAGIAYLLPAIPFSEELASKTQVSGGELKLADVVMYVTAFALIASIVAVIANLIVNAVKK